MIKYKLLNLFPIKDVFVKSKQEINPFKCTCVSTERPYPGFQYLLHSVRQVGEFLGKGTEYMGGFCVKVLHAYVDG